MLRKIWILPLFALFLFTLSAAEMTVFVGENAGDAVVVPEESGYALAYWDYAPDPVRYLKKRIREKKPI